MQSQGAAAHSFKVVTSRVCRMMQGHVLWLIQGRSHQKYSPGWFYNGLSIPWVLLALMQGQGFLWMKYMDITPVLSPKQYPFTFDFFTSLEASCFNWCIILPSGHSFKREGITAFLQIHLMHSFLLLKHHVFKWSLMQSVRLIPSHEKSHILACSSHFKGRSHIPGSRTGGSF